MATYRKYRMVLLVSDIEDIILLKAIKRETFKYGQKIKKYIKGIYTIWMSAGGFC